jgi:hypothetical protein
MPFQALVLLCVNSRLARTCMSRSSFVLLQFEVACFTHFSGLRILDLNLTQRVSGTAAQQFCHGAFAVPSLVAGQTAC